MMLKSHLTSPSLPSLKRNNTATARSSCCFCLPDVSSTSNNTAPPSCVKDIPWDSGGTDRRGGTVTEAGLASWEVPLLWLWGCPNGYMLQVGPIHKSRSVCCEWGVAWGGPGCLGRVCWRLPAAVLQNVKAVCLRRKPGRGRQSRASSLKKEWALCSFCSQGLAESQLRQTRFQKWIRGLIWREGLRWQKEGVLCLKCHPSMFVCKTSAHPSKPHLRRFFLF